MSQNKKNFSKKAGIRWGTIFGVFLVVFFIATRIVPTPTFVQDEDKGTWHVIFEFSSVRAENESLPQTDSRWLSFFLLDYTENPATALVHNNTDWSAADNTTGYQDVDNAPAMDLQSERYSYFVCRGAINITHCGDSGIFFGNRTRCHFTISGDETVTNQVVYGDNTSYTSGGGMISYNVTVANGGKCIFVNYYIDDNNDGYRITDDGSLTWNITVMARY